MLAHHYTAKAFFEGNDMAEESFDFDAGSKEHDARQWALKKAQEGLVGVVYDQGSYMGEYDPEDPSLKAYPAAEPKEPPESPTSYGNYQLYCNEVRRMGWPKEPMRYEMWMQLADALGTANGN